MCRRRRHLSLLYVLCLAGSAEICLAKHISVSLNLSTPVFPYILARDEWEKEKRLVKLPFPCLLQVRVEMGKCGKRQDEAWLWGLGLSGRGIFNGEPSVPSSLVLSVMPCEEQVLLGTVASGSGETASPNICRGSGKCPGQGTSQGSLALKMKWHLQTLGMKLCHLSVKRLSAQKGLQHLEFAAMLARRMFFNKSVTL